MALAAILIDLGDVIMQETTEEKIDDVTQRADLVPGMADLLRDWHQRGVPLGLVADTRPGTYRNVLTQHGLYDLFGAFAISDELGAVKPDARMFQHALAGLRVPAAEWGRVVMIGNNLARDIRGANALGLISIWFAWNDRYPGVPADPAETPRYQAGDAAALGALIAALDADAAAGADGAASDTARSGDADVHRYPRPFPWLEVKDA